MKISNGIKLLAVISFVIILPVSVFAGHGSQDIICDPNSYYDPLIDECVSNNFNPQGLPCNPDTDPNCFSSIPIQDPGSPGFIGPVQQSTPGSPGFIGPVQQSTPGSPGFIGPVQPDSGIPCAPGAGKICDPLQERFGTVPELIKTILEGAIRIGMPLVALAIVYCGFLFVFARGNSEKLTKARDALVYTMIGAAVLLGSWAIAKMISDTVTALSP